MSTPLSRAMDQMAEADQLREENIRLQAEIERLEKNAVAWEQLATELRAEIERLKADRDSLRQDRDLFSENLSKAEAKLERVVYFAKRLLLVHEKRSEKEAQQIVDGVLAHTLTHAAAKGKK